MSRIGLAIRLVVTAFIVMMMLMPWIASEPGSWGFRLDRAALREGRAVIAPVEGLQLPDGLHAGDRIDTPRMTVGDRLIINAPAIKPGSELVLPVRVDGKASETTPRRVVVRAVTHGAAPLSFMWMEWPFLLLGMLLLWKGRGAVALGMTILMVSIGSTGSLLWASLPVPWSFPQRILLEYVMRPMTALGVLIIMLGLLGKASPRLSKWMIWINALLYAGYLLDRLIKDLPWILQGKVSFGILMSPSIPLTMAFIAQFVVFGVLVSRRVDAASRLRGRWVLLGILLYSTYILVAIFGNAEYLWILPYFLSVLALAYSALRHKLVPTSFAISRTLVYGIVAALIVGVFAVVEHAVAAMAMGKNAGLAVHLSVPLVLGILVHRIHGKVEHWVERLFFRRQFEAEARLERLTQESPYVAQPGPLVARTLQDVSTALHAPRVALYWHDADGSYRRRGQAGEGAWPKRIDVDDPAFVTLRAGKAWADLISTGSPLGVGGVAFPMRVAGRLQGAIVCGDRTSQYAQEERKLMARVADAIGTALQGLSAQASENAIDGLLTGRITLEDARRQLGRPESAPSEAATGGQAAFLAPD